MKSTTVYKRTFTSIIRLMFLCLMLQSVAWAQTKPQKISSAHQQELLKQFSQKSTVRVIVRFSTQEDDDSLNQTTRETIRNKAIHDVQQNIQAKLRHNNAIVKREFSHIPYLAIDLDNASLSELEAMDEIVSIQIDQLRKPYLAESIPIIGADEVWNNSVTGAGQTVAILDSGVDSSHSFLYNKVVAEACFSTTRALDAVSSLCPSGANSQIGTGAGLECVGANGCYHGTHVAGISAGNGDSFSGVAKDANIISIQVFSRIEDSDFCGSSTPCIGAYDSDVIKGLEQVYDLKDNFNIAAVNISLGGGSYSTQASCDAANSGYLAAISSLREQDIAVVIASGNDSSSNGISAPGCVSGAISVGATTDTDTIASFTNRASYLSYLAPGVSIKSSVPGGGFSNLQGTSMAAPHVAGAIALLSSADDSIPLDNILSVLTNSAVVINASYPRIQVNDALDLLLGNTQAKDKLSLTVSVDNSEQVYFNGVLVGSSSNWNKASSYTLAMASGKNVIAIKAQDVDGIAALIAHVTHNEVNTYSDENWKVSTVYEDGWDQPSFDDSAWSAATSYGFYGMSPWQQRVSGLPSDSPAQWIWTANNDADNIAYFRYSVQGNNDVEPPLIATEILESGEVKVPYSALIEVNAGSYPLTWTLISGDLPSGLSLDSNNGSLTGVPSISGEFNFVIQVQDALKNVDSMPLTLSINPDSSEVPSQINLLISADNTNEVYFNGTLIGSSSNWNQAGVYTLDVQNGKNILAIKATDQGGVAALIAELSSDGWFVVSDNNWLVSTSLETNWAHISFDDSAWNFASMYGVYGVAPWNKRVSGMPTDSSAQWIWSDNNEADNTVYFRLAIELATTAEPITFTTLDLADAQVNANYNDSVKVSGGSAPYTWRILSGNLPAGLTLEPATGAITGVPNLAATTSFDIQVEDSKGQLASQRFTINVEPILLNILLSADDISETYFNGTLLGTSDDWKKSSSYVVTLTSGENVVAVKGSDIFSKAGFIAQLIWGNNTVVSDESWKVSTTGASNWQQIGFDDSLWAQASTFGTYGTSPWLYNVSSFPNSSGAQWIWSSNNVDDDQVYFRFIINLP